MCAEPAGCGLELTAQIVIDRRESVPELGVSLNGSWPTFDAVQTEELLMPTGTYAHHAAGHLGLNHGLRIEDIREGWNEIVVYDGEDAPSPQGHALKPGVRICGPELRVA